MDKKILLEFKNSKKAEDRMFFARVVKTMIEMADIFLARKNLLTEEEIKEVENRKSKLENILNNFKIYENH